MRIVHVGVGKTAKFIFIVITCGVLCLLLPVGIALWLLPLYWPAGLAAAALPLAVQLAQSLLAGWMMQKSRHVLAPALYRAISAWLSLLG